MSARHVFGCVAVVLTAALVLAVFAPSANALATIAVFLLCPLIMLIAMKLLIGGGHAAHEQHEPASRPVHPEEIGR